MTGKAQKIEDAPVIRKEPETEIQIIREEDELKPKHSKKITDNEEPSSNHPKEV
jgi:hypothetical protein